MPFRITAGPPDVQRALTDQGYTAARADRLDRLDAAVSSRAAPGAAMDIVAGARAAIWNEAIPAVPAAGSYGERINANLDVSIGTRATPGDIDSVMEGRGLTLARIAKLDTIQAQVRATGNVAAAANTAGLTVTLDGNYRTVVEVRYTCGGPAEFFVEGSDDGTTWWEGDRFSEAAAVTDGIVGYLTARRFTRMRSPTPGIDLSFELVALL